jgi:hypothetical protein
VQSLIVGAVTALIVANVAGAAPSIGRMLGDLARGKTLDTYIQGNYGSSGYMMCNNGAGPTFNTISNCGAAVSGNSPSVTQQPLCATGSGTAQFESASACGLTTPATMVMSFGAWCTSQKTSNEVCGLFQAPAQGTVVNLQAQTQTAGVGASNMVVKVFDRTTSSNLCTTTVVCTASNPTISCAANFATNDVLDVRLDTSACTSGPAGQFNVAATGR